MLAHSISSITGVNNECRLQLWVSRVNPAKGPAEMYHDGSAVVMRMSWFTLIRVTYSPEGRYNCGRNDLDGSLKASLGLSKYCHDARTSGIHSRFEVEQ